ncbi:ABC transporter ATP-binding protein [Parvimonas micra]|uniref:ABC transporter ATP-binding protein/permease n=1 Tax=Parvimonas micra TaxID=33033 RepID=A0A9X3HAX7_9FIRM|nr:ABC transporter ATP-binding protein [Parvimonas micra]MCZ7407946.1 ABC transporter ATP-binding protein/permease [Parvimonas micra]MCZ7410578.1 ABC transporter ATP-binding protein/permease [Parvimonas micra]MCZ7412224.1 ABC transporter ATP-binding protein/permease [Parvimonas micra]WBB36487.1 ABC transporter ATP-binding protein/permease [Parvimonas micra]
MKNNKKSTLLRVLKEIFAAYPVLFPLVLVGIVFTAGVSSIPSLFIQRIVSLLEARDPSVSWSVFSKQMMGLILILIAVDILSLVLTAVYNLAMATLTQGTLYQMRKKMFVKMQSLPLKYFDTEGHGDIMSYYTNDVDALRQMISQSLPNVLASLVVVITVFGIMLYFSFWMTLTVLLGVVAMYYVTKYVGKHSRKYFIEQQKSLGKTEGYLEEMIYGQKVVKVFNYEDESMKKFNEVNDKLFDDSQKANSYANILGPILNNIGNILYVVVAIVGGLLIYFNVYNLSFSGMAISISIVVPFLNMTKQFSGNINQVSMQLNSIIMGLAGVERVFALIDQEPEVDEGKVEIEKEKDKYEFVKENGEKVEVLGNIDIKNIVFGYNKEKTVLKNINITAKQGEKIALVGATGSGKTTIANLINRFYDVNSGEILFDGINVNSIKKADLRKNVGVVLQETNLFTGTVLENLRYGHLEATREECIEACKKTGAHEFIIKLPEQYDTVLRSGGENLSQGQRQLLGISRALLENKPVLILDEATSSIDTKTENVVQKAMYVLMEGRTVFIIAHRLSTISNSDRIIVLDNGEILEMGTHDELIEKQGRYYQLYTGKFELD